MQPEVMPKGKARKAMKKAHYRAELFTFVMRFTCIQGTSGVVRMTIRVLDDVRVNGVVEHDDHRLVKPGDVVSVNCYEGGLRHHYEVTADAIEKCWR